MKKIPELAVIVPCYNEEEALPQSIKTLSGTLNNLIKSGLIGENSRLVFVNDGSKDSTWKIIENAHKRSPLVKGISLSRNFGHQEALLAGLYNTECQTFT